MQLLHYVSHWMMCRTPWLSNRTELRCLIWAPVEPPPKRAKTAEVRLSSTGDVSMTPKKEENEQSSSNEEDSDSSGSNSDVSSEDDTSDVSDLDKFEEAYSDFGARCTSPVKCHKDTQTS